MRRGTVSSTDRRRHILFIIPTLTGGGAERVFVTLLQHLDRERFRASLAILDTRDAVFLADIPSDVAVIDLQCRKLRYAFRKIVDLVWRLRPDTILSTLNHLNIGVAATRIFWPRGIKLVVRPTGLPPREDRRHFLENAFSRLLSLADGYIFQSEELKSEFCASFGLNPSRGVAIYNPVDIAKIRSLAEAPVDTGYAPGYFHLVAAGRLAKEKRFDCLLQAMAYLVDRPVRLTILGEGELRDELEATAARLGVSESVRFAGFQSNPYPYLKSANLYVLSSGKDTFPNIVLEALACGTPVVATELPGITEALSGIDGYETVPVGNARALAEAISRRVDAGDRRVDETAIDSFDAANICRRYEQEMG
jgi:glycosyltransferase involved in cell wall biosynthesis